MPDPKPEKTTPSEGTLQEEEQAAQSGGGPGRERGTHETPKPECPIIHIKEFKLDEDFEFVPTKEAAEASLRLQHSRKLRELRDKQAKLERELKEASEQLEARKRELAERSKKDSDPLHVPEAPIDFSREGFAPPDQPDLTRCFEGADTEEVRQETQDIPLLSESELPPRPTDGRASKVERRIKASELPAAFERIEARLARFHDPVVNRFQRILDTLHEKGKACARFEDNQELTRRVVEMADRFGIRLFFETPDQEQHEVRLHCVHVTGTAAGVFRVQAANKKNTQLSSSPTFPRLVAARTLEK
jgi:hypothetical protein